MFLKIMCAYNVLKFNFGFIKSNVFAFQLKFLRFFTILWIRFNCDFLFYFDFVHF